MHAMMGLDTCHDGGPGTSVMMRRTKPQLIRLVDDWQMATHSSGVFEPMMACTCASICQWVGGGPLGDLLSAPGVMFSVLWYMGCYVKA